MRHLGTVVLLAFALSASNTALGGEAVCTKTVGLLTTEFQSGVPNSQLARVEVRQCPVKESATIQLVAWRTGEANPFLVVNTDDFGVVQAAGRANVFVIETGGATRDQVFVIVYTHGEPKLMFRRITKGSARISISPSALDLVVEGIYAGDEPPKTERQHFLLAADGMKRVAR